MIALRRTFASIFRRNRPNYQRSPIRSPLVVKSSKSSFFNRTMDFLLDVCESYAYFDTSDRLTIYFILLNVCSFMGRLMAPLPQYYFTGKRNIFNDYFVKKGLLWTIGLLAPFIFYTSKRIGSTFGYIRGWSRLLIVILCWYLITTVFMNVESWSGVCTAMPTLSDSGVDLTVPHASELLDNVDAKSPLRQICGRKGGRWFAFEISGHCFLLVYCALVIAEELLVFRRWKLTKRRPLTPPPPQPQPNAFTQLEANEQQKIIEDQEDAKKVNGLFIALNLLLLLWDFMFVITCLYYHTWFEQICGFLCAAACWFLTYGWWYYSPYSPGFPGAYKLKKYTVLKRIAAD